VLFRNRISKRELKGGNGIKHPWLCLHFESQKEN